MTDARNFLLNTDYPIDKIAGSLTGSMVIGANDTMSDIIPHSFGCYLLPLLQWSTTPDFSISYNETSTGYIQGCLMSMYTTTSNLYINGLNSTGSSIALYYRVIYFVPDNADIDVPETQSGLDNFVLNTDYNYPKLIPSLSGTVPTTVATSTATITHNLGYYPQVEVWYVPTSTSRCYHLSSGDPSYTYLDAVLTTTNIKFSYPGADCTWYYRIYVDEN